MAEALQLLVNGIAVGALYALAAVGVALIFWTTKVFHIAHGATYLLAGYAYLELRDTSVPLAIVASCLTAALFGYLLNEVVYRPIQRRSHDSFFTVFVASFGVLIVVTNTVSLLFGSGVKTIPPLASNLEIGFVQISAGSAIGVGITLLVLVSLGAFLRTSRTGIGLRAMADSVQLVDQLGLDRRKYASVAFIVGSLLVVPAAILTTHAQGMTPQFGLSIASMALIVSIAGGIGSLSGAIVGAFVLGVVQNISTLVVDPVWAEAVGYSLLLAVLVFRPAGILPKVST